MAARSLDKRTDPETIDALAAALGRKTERGWSAPKLRALSAEPRTGRLRALADHRSVAHAKVRRAIVSALGEFQTAEAAEILARAAKQDESYLVSADAARALGRRARRGSPDARLGAREASWADVKRAGALDGLAALRDEAAVRRSSTRRATDTLPARRARYRRSRASDDRKTRLTWRICWKIRTAFPHGRRAGLEQLGDGRARGALRTALGRELDGRVARRLREALRALGDEGGASASASRRAGTAEA